MHAKTKSISSIHQKDVKVLRYSIFLKYEVKAKGLLGKNVQDEFKMMFITSNISSNRLAPQTHFNPGLKLIRKSVTNPLIQGNDVITLKVLWK